MNNILEQARVSEEIWDFHTDSCRTCKIFGINEIFIFCKKGLEIYMNFVTDHTSLINEIKNEK